MYISIAWTLLNERKYRKESMKINSEKTRREILSARYRNTTTNKETNSVNDKTAAYGKLLTTSD